MPMSPYGGATGLAHKIRREYEEAERIMVSRVARKLARGIDEPGWAEAKRNEIADIRRKTERQIAALENKSEEEIKNAVTKAYKRGDAAAIAELKGLKKPEEIKKAFTATNERAVRALVEETHTAVKGMGPRILRTSLDGYRHIISQATTPLAMGVETRREAAQRALHRFADRGISGFTDAAGRRWDIASYAEMATRTASGRAAVKGHADRAAENGYDLVVVSIVSEPCELCDPWEGRILCRTGEHEEYPAFEEAESEGLFHPNCRHNVTIWVPGMSQDIKDKQAPDRRQKYKESQQQRYNERQIRKWKKREAAAITPEEERKAKAKIKEWQGRQREFLERTDLRRKYEREQIKRAR